MLGTLSFGTRSRETFSPDDLALMKAVTDQVAVAMERMQNEQALRNSEESLRKANEELEEAVRKRTRALEDTVAALKNEVVVRKKSKPSFASSPEYLWTPPTRSSSRIYRGRSSN